MRLILLLLIVWNFGWQQLTAQCVDQEAHNTSIISHWLSCAPSANPLGTIPESHWILYQFDAPVGIEGIKVWNLNHPDFLNMGAREVRIDYSVDGASWSTLDTVTLEQGAGEPDFLGVDVEEIDNFDAQYVLFTMLNNYGGNCVGLAEVKFQLGALSTSNEEVISNQLKTWPNPVHEMVSIELGEWNGKVSQYQIVDQLGRIVASDKVANVNDNGVVRISTIDYAAGHYVINLRGEEAIINQSLIVIHPD